MEITNIRRPSAFVDTVDQTSTVDQIELISGECGSAKRPIQVVPLFFKLFDCVLFTVITVVIVGPTSLPGIDVDPGELSRRQLRSHCPEYYIALQERDEFVALGMSSV